MPPNSNERARHRPARHNRLLLTTSSPKSVRGRSTAGARAGFTGVGGWWDDGTDDALTKGELDRARAADVRVARWLTGEVG